MDNNINDVDSLEKTSENISVGQNNNTSQYDVNRNTIKYEKPIEEQKVEPKKFTLSDFIIFLFGTGLIIVLYYGLNKVIRFDNNFIKNITAISFAVLVIRLFIYMCINRHIKILSKLLNIYTIFSVILIIYYIFFSTKLESIYILHDRYNIDFKSMKMIEDNVYKDEIICLKKCTESDPRKNIINYNNIDIRLHYSNNDWYDNYDEIIMKKENNKELVTLFTSTIKKHTKNYKIIQNNLNYNYSNLDEYDSIKDSYKYFVFMQNDSASDVGKAIKEINDSFEKQFASNKNNYNYSLIVVKDLDAYQKLDFEYLTKLSLRQMLNQTSSLTIKDMFRYETSKITHNELGYNELYFSENGDKNDPLYKESLKYKSYVFVYDYVLSSTDNRKSVDIYALSNEY